MALGFVSGRKTVTTPGNAVALSSYLRAAIAVYVSALKTNTKPVCVGGSTVLATPGSESGVLLNPGETVSLYGGISNEGGLIDMRTLYVDAEVAGEGVCFLATRT